MSRLWRPQCLAVILTLSLLFCGRAHAQDVILQGLTSGNFRYKDIGGQAFAQSFINSYSYAFANVTLSLDTPNLKYLSGQITATGLKPNFAYQIKLVGNPSKVFTNGDGDDATNETLGRLGRWWRAQPNPANSNDADYDANNDNSSYIYEGYLIIGFFITDEHGSATLRLEGNNSFHVLWRIDQRPRSINDGPLCPVTVPLTSGNSAYDTPLASRDFSLYGEWEPTRALPGTLQMPDGHYHCRMLLTEESFHDYGSLAGNWTAAMSAPLDFDIPTVSEPVTPPPDTPPESALPLEITRIRAYLNQTHSGRDRAWITGSITLPAGFQPANLEVTATALGVERKFLLNEHGRGAIRNGMLEFLAGGSGGKAIFKLRVVGADFPQSSYTNASVLLKLGADDYYGTVTPKSKLGAIKGRLEYRK